MATLEEISDFLGEAKVLIDARRFTLEPRQINIDGMEELGITAADAVDRIRRLTPNNYCGGPEDDRDRPGTLLWKFGATVSGDEAYIKLKIELGGSGNFLKILSFHPAERPLRYPLRPRR